MVQKFYCERYLSIQSMLGKKEKKYQNFNIFDYTYLPKTDICLCFFLFFSMNLSLIMLLCSLSRVCTLHNLSEVETPVSFPRHHNHHHHHHHHGAPSWHPVNSDDYGRWCCNGCNLSIHCMHQSRIPLTVKPRHCHHHHSCYPHPRRPHNHPHHHYPHHDQFWKDLGSSEHIWIKSLGARPGALTSSWRLFGPLDFVLRALRVLSVTHATVIG